MPMTPEAKRALSQTIRALRARLLEDLHNATDAAFRLSVDVRHSGLDEAPRKKRKRLDDWIAEQMRARARITCVPRQDPSGHSRRLRWP